MTELVDWLNHFEFHLFLCSEPKLTRQNVLIYVFLEKKWLFYFYPGRIQFFDIVLDLQPIV